MESGFTIKRADELESMDGSGGCAWSLVRKSLGVGSFGINVVEIPAGSSIVEHTESESGQEEVFAILEGEATFVADGSEHPAPAGTFARFAPEVSRNVLNHSDGPVKALLIGVSPEGGYEPPSWA